LGKIIDLKEQRFGKLVVKEMSGKNKYNSVLWLCDCDCGKKNVTVNGANLRRGFTTSCGCKVKEQISKIAKHNQKYFNFDRRLIKPFYSQFLGYIKHDKYNCELNYDKFEKLILEPCYYCGNKHDIKKIRIGGNNRNKTYLLKINGIDRIDSKKGYLIDNVVPCCATCNKAKNVMTKKEFLSWIERVYKHSIENKLETKGETIND